MGKNDEYKELEFLANKSKELIEKQTESYKNKHNNSAIIITVLSIFIPFFLNTLDNSTTIIKIIAILPVFLSLIAIFKLLQVLWTKPLYQGFNFGRFEYLINKSYKKILLYEIGANKNSFEDNESIIDKTNSNYSLAIILTYISIIISVALISINQFQEKEKSPIEVIVINKK